MITSEKYEELLEQTPYPTKQRRMVYIAALQVLETEPTLPQHSSYLIKRVRHILKGKVTSVDIANDAVITEIIENICLVKFENLYKLPIELIKDYSEDGVFKERKDKMPYLYGVRCLLEFPKRKDGGDVTILADKKLIERISDDCNSMVVGGSFLKHQQSRRWVMWNSTLCTIITNVCLDMDIHNRQVFLDHFPEVLKHKPCGITNGIWFDLNENGFNERVKILEQAIEDTK